jgi:hypothetical protein
LQARLRNDPMFENAVRREWGKLCRSIPLGGAATGLPSLWLEMKPTRAIASAQPRVDGNAVTMNVGMQAETRIGAAQTKPDCPFPATLSILPAADQGRIAIGVPIDLPFTEVNKLIEAQLKGQTFATDAADIQVRKAALAASGDRLLISLLVNAKEKKSWFGFGVGATVHVWGKPVLDQARQILRLNELSIAVESDAAFGLLGAAARAALPYVQDQLAQNAVIDLKPFAADAREKISAATAEFRQVTPGVVVETNIAEVRLVGIEFDAKTLRIITEAQGSAKVSITDLPKT